MLCVKKELAKSRLENNKLLKAKMAKRLLFFMLQKLNNKNKNRRI
jgi:hypothetical protein